MYERKRVIYSGMPKREPMMQTYRAMTLDGAYFAGIVDEQRRNGFLEGTHQIREIGDVVELDDPKETLLVRARL